MQIIKSPELEKEFFSYQEDEELAAVGEIIAAVKQDGDAAVREYTRKFDDADIEDFAVDSNAIRGAYAEVDSQTVAALKTAAENIRRFAQFQRQQLQDFEVELIPGVFTGQRVLPLQRVGIYVPGGNFPLISSLLMGAIPALVAGVEDICVCSPPTYGGSLHPAILVAADVAGIGEVYRVGGAQAIAALAFGTDSIPRVDKIVGPGNKYVAQAKRAVFGGVSIDMIAGPTEILIIADESADPHILAADLLAQAEHDRDARPLLVTPSAKLAEAVQKEVKKQLESLDTRATAAEAVRRHGRIILVENLAEAAEISNRKAPEHLEIQVKNAPAFSQQLRHYGSLFIGELSAEVLGDYSSGINHTLPTNTTARYRGGLSVHDFLKIHTTLRTTAEGVEQIGSVAETLARAEGLTGHARSVAKRRLPRD